MKRKAIRPLDQALENLRHYISSNKLGADSPLPSERELSNMWDISRTTIRSALEKLRLEGEVYKKKGVGTFVASRKVLHDVRVAESTTESLRKQGHVNKVRLLSNVVIDADTSLIDHLHVPLGTRVRELERLRFIDGVPSIIEKNFLPGSIYRRLSNYLPQSQSLYSALAGIGYKVSQGNESIEVVEASQSEQGLLNLKNGNLLFLIKGNSYDAEGKLLEYFKAVSRPDMTRFVSVLKK